MEFVRAEKSVKNKNKTVIKIKDDIEIDSDLDSSDDGFALPLSVISEVPTGIDDLDTIHVVEEVEVEMGAHFIFFLFAHSS